MKMRHMSCLDYYSETEEKFIALLAYFRFGIHWISNIFPFKYTFLHIWIIFFLNFSFECRSCSRELLLCISSTFFTGAVIIIFQNGNEFVWCLRCAIIVFHHISTKMFHVWMSMTHRHRLQKPIIRYTIRTCLIKPFKYQLFIN